VVEAGESCARGRRGQRRRPGVRVLAAFLWGRSRQVMAAGGGGGGVKCLNCQRLLDSYWMARIPHVHRQDHMHPSQKTASLGMGVHCAMTEREGESGR
jgi:hypothetical protein